MEHDQTANDVHKMLSESGYSEKAIRYFQDKENIGILDKANQITDMTGPCGDTMKISLSIDGETINDARIQVLGCPGAVASGCALVNITRGKSIEEASRIDLDALYKELEKLPEKKIHCARLAIKTLQKAIEEYKGKKGQAFGSGGN
jgi:nitrogen fixation NifU-like protein